MKNHLPKRHRHLYKRLTQLIERGIKNQAHQLANLVTVVLLIAAVSLLVALLANTVKGYWQPTSRHPRSTQRQKPQMTTTAPTTTTKKNPITAPFKIPTTAITTKQYRKAPPSNETAHWYKVTVKTNDSPILIFKSLGLDLHSLHTILTLGRETKTLMQVKPGQAIHVFATDSHKLIKLIYPINLTDTLYVTHSPEGFYAYREHRSLEERIEYKQADHIDQSLFNTAYKAGLSDNIVITLMDIFGWNIDFAKDIRPKDSFKVMYHAYYLDGTKVRDGAILEAQFTNQGKTYTAIAFTPPKGKTTFYYTPEGLSLQRPFLRTPVKYTRISSVFSLGRYHPVLHLIRAHKGVDYAAPYGTPIHATSDGVITFIGKRGGYGNAIILSHGKKYSTLYGHMAYFAKGMKKNKRVHQKEVIGYVGKTGLATGTHLHYEFRINGVHHDPLKVKLPAAQPISKQYRKAFLRQAKPVMAEFKKQAASFRQ